MEQDKEWDIGETEAPSRTSGDQPANTGEEDVNPQPQPGEETGGEPKPAETSAETERMGGGEHPEPVQKRAKRGARKELLELIQRKNTMLQELDKEVKKTKQDLQKQEDRLLRLAAEFENYRKRTRREWELLQKRANADLIKEIIEGMDNFDRAFENLGGIDDQVRDGLRLIYSGLMDVLRKAGLSEIEAMQRKFDPLYHEAVGEIEDDMEEGHVAQVIRKGYLLNETVIRPARVIVSKKKG